MENDSGPLNMAEEFYAEPFSFWWTFNKSGDIRDDEFVIDPKIRLERGERIICYPAFGACKFV